jgi:hypothetical protein
LAQRVNWSALLNIVFLDLAGVRYARYNPASLQPSKKCITEILYSIKKLQAPDDFGASLRQRSAAPRRRCLAWGRTLR